MDDEIEIDLRKLILNLLANWKIILGISFFFGLVAFLYSYLQPDVYQARALIVITKPRYIANFDPQFQTVTTSSPSSKALLDVVVSDSIVSQVYEYWKSDQKELVTYKNFRENALEASAGGDTSNLFLNVKLKYPEEAAELANQWALLSVKQINSLYSGVDENQLAFFDQQIEISTINMRNAENALTEFNASDQSAIFQNELNSLLAMQTANLRKQRVLENSRQDAVGLLEILEDNPDNTFIIGQIFDNFKVLQIRLYADSGAGQTPFQIQIMGDNALGDSLMEIQISPDVGTEQLPIEMQVSKDPVNINFTDLQILITEWMSILDQQAKELQENSSIIDVQVLEYQQQLSEFHNDRQALELEYSVVKETYETLLRKQKEVRISNDSESGDAQIASFAKVPVEQMGHNTVRNTAIAIIAGGILAILLIILRDWFKQEIPEAS